MNEFYDPANDGVTHINIYSRGRTELGRALSHFADIPIRMSQDPNDTFRCVEGYWYWLGRQDKRLRYLAGYEAKKLGRTLPIIMRMSEHAFRDAIRVANFYKLLQHPWLMTTFVDSTLPFAHYYVFNGGYAKSAGFPWLVTMWEKLRMECRTMGYR